MTGRDTGSVRTALRVLGELLITAGVVVLLYVVYVMLWTNTQATASAQRTVAALRDEWARPPVHLPAPGSPTHPPAPRVGEAFALLYVPRLGSGWVRPVVEGVGPAALAAGVGHYPRTALPGQLGNFAVAGHRATHGEPFAHLDRLVAGDQVHVRTRDRWLSYAVERSRIVTPDAVEVLLPVPGRPGAAPTRARLTLTTCHPRWGSTSRLVVHAALTASRPVATGPPPGVKVPV